MNPTRNSPQFYAVALNTICLPSREEATKFYKDKLGMKILAEVNDKANHRYILYLGYREQDLKTQGSCIFEVMIPTDVRRRPPSPFDGFNSFVLTVPNLTKLQLAHAQTDKQILSGITALEGHGLVAYLKDPACGYVEIAQESLRNKDRRTEEEIKADEASPNALRLRPESLTVSQIRIQVKDPKTSLRFYRDLLGMTVLHQAESAILGNKYTLFYLGFPPSELKHQGTTVESRREFAFTRKFTLLVLMYTEGLNIEKFQFLTSGANESGWQGLSISCDDASAALQFLKSQGLRAVFQEPRWDIYCGKLCSYFVDPDGYPIRFIQATVDGQEQ